MDIRKKTISILLAVIILFSCLPFCSAATENVPAESIIISSAEDLAKLGGNEITGNIELAQDIDMSNEDMQPIAKLTGTFDGNGYTISNLTISGEAPTGWTEPDLGLGLIGNLNGTVCNLTLDNAARCV